MTEAFDYQAEKIAHRRCTQYRHNAGPGEPMYSFTAAHLLDFARELVGELAKGQEPVAEVVSEGSFGMDVISLVKPDDYSVKAGTKLYTHPAVAAPAGAPNLLVEIGRRIGTQDNRCTDSPIFIVEQKRTYVTEEGYNDSRTEWHETESGDYITATEEEAERLEDEYQRTLEEPEGWKRLAVFDVWEFVTACFTEHGCKDYLRRNGHNLSETRIYAACSYRNEEFQAVRAWLESLSAAPAAPADAEFGDKDHFSHGALLSV